MAETRMRFEVDVVFDFDSYAENGEPRWAHQDPQSEVSRLDTIARNAVNIHSALTEALQSEYGNDPAVLRRWVKIMEVKDI